MKRLCLCLAVVVGLAGVAAQAAPPYYPTAVNDLKDARVHRNVYVDSAGRCSAKHRCDFRDLGDALTWVAAQAPTASARWTVRVFPGNTGFTEGGFSYAETTLTIPPFTAVEGISDAYAGAILLAGQPWIQLTGTSGALVTASGGSSISNLGLYASANPTAALAVVRAAAADPVTIRNLAIVSAGSDAFATNIVEIVGGTVFASGLHTQRANVGTLSRNIKVSGDGVLVLQDSNTYPSNSPAAIEVTSGTVRVFGGRIAAGATVDLLQTGGTMTADGVAYSPAKSGAVTRYNPQGTPKHTSGNATLPTVCEVPELYTDTSGSPRICSCTAANTWRCAALSTP